MKKVLKITTILMATLALLIVVVWNFTGSMCGIELFNKITSPNSNFVAIHEMVDCGATTNHVTSIFVEKKHSLPKKINIFALNGYYDEGRISLKWENENTLRIDYSGKPIDIRKINFSIRDIKVRIYINNEELTADRLRQIEKEIVDDQASYNIFLPEGKQWIEVEQ